MTPWTMTPKNCKFFFFLFGCFVEMHYLCNVNINYYRLWRQQHPSPPPCIVLSKRLVVNMPRAKPSNAVPQRRCNAISTAYDLHDWVFQGGLYIYDLTIDNWPLLSYSSVTLWQLPYLRGAAYFAIPPTAPPQSSPSGGLRGDKNGFLPLRTPPKGREEGVPFRAGAYDNL